MNPLWRGVISCLFFLALIIVMVFACDAVVRAECIRYWTSTGASAIECSNDGGGFVPPPGGPNPPPRVYPPRELPIEFLIPPVIVPFQPPSQREVEAPRTTEVEGPRPVPTLRIRKP